MKPKTGSPEHWIGFALGDLRLAERRQDKDIYTELLCFHCAQCVEKCLKALLVKLEIEPPATHSISTLIRLVQTKLKVPIRWRNWRRLTKYSILYRYPGEYERATNKDYEQAFKCAKDVYEWANALIAERR